MFVCGVCKYWCMRVCVCVVYVSVWCMLCKCVGYVFLCVVYVSECDVCKCVWCMGTCGACTYVVYACACLCGVYKYVVVM